MKKFISLVLAFLFLCAFALSVSADEPINDNATDFHSETASAGNTTTEETNSNQDVANSVESNPNNANNDPV